MADAKQLVKEYEAIKAQRGTWENTWQEVADNIMGRGDFTADQPRRSGQEYVQQHAPGAAAAVSAPAA